MNDLRAQDELLAQLPDRLKGKVAWVFPRLHWPLIDVAFYRGGGQVQVVSIPHEHWLDAWAIAKICLEAP